MRLDQASWLEVEEYLKRSTGIIIPVGSTEQHGPMGLIGTDALCAEKIGEGAGEIASALVAPTLAYCPAPFNMAFAGTISITEALFEQIIRQIVEGLLGQGFTHIYFLNGHGANLAPIKRVRAQLVERVDNEGIMAGEIMVRSWWEGDAVNALRQQYYGDWEGMHATPSEVAITQTTHRVISPGLAKNPPKKLSAQYMREHAGDRHGPPDQHRKDFPDGRVGSHSALATPQQGRKLLDVARQAIADDYLQFVAKRG